MDRHSVIGTRPGGRAARGVIVWLAAVLVCLPAAACSQREACSVAVPPATFIGRASSVDRGVVTFDVESATVRQLTAGVTPAAGQPVRISYGSAARYLHVGTRYEVDTSLPGPDGNLTSTIAGTSSCGLGTRYADGRSIDTSIISIGGLHTGGIIAIGVTLALATVIASGITVRRRRRRADQRAIIAWKSR